MYFSYFHKDKNEGCGIGAEVDEEEEEKLEWLHLYYYLKKKGLTNQETQAKAFLDVLASLRSHW